jgi:radical SAM superfamily enzyme YgiQ (UPF0313 family)
MVLATIGRLIMVPLAFLLAMLAASAVLLSLGLERVTVAMTNSDGEEAIGTVFGVLKYGWILTSGVTLLPACLIVLAGEISRIRSAIYYIVGGGAAMAAIPLLARLGPQAASGGASIFSWQVFATAGFVGGFVYWLIAGRRA